MMSEEDAKDLVHENISDFHLSEGQLCGVVVKKIPVSRRHHCGIVFKYNDQSRLIHLNWHCDLRLQNPDNLSQENYFWVESSLHPIRQKMVAVMCNRISERYWEKRIPFGLIYENTRFNANGEVIYDDNEYGLTCATFVLAVYDSCGINLLDLKSWPERNEDIVWNNEIIKTLERNRSNYGVTDAHIEKMKKSAGSARFRPEEVAAGTMFKYKDLPVSFHTVLPYSESVKRKLK